jgi:hypothetical protein
MQDVFNKAKTICRELKADFVPEDRLALWGKSSSWDA